MTPDEERLQRYLEWRRAGERDRVERRRRVIGYVMAPALCVIAVGVAAWLGRPSDRPASVNAVAPPVRDERAPSPSGSPVASSHPPPPEPPTVELSEPPARPQPRSAPAVASRPRVRPAPSSRLAPAAPGIQPAPPTDGVAGEPDVAAAVAPAPRPAPVIPAPETPRETPEQRRETVSEAPREAPSEVLRPRAPSDVVAVPLPRPEAAAQNPPVENPPPAAPSGGAVAVASPTVRERVSTWAKGEVQEFRHGVKREIAEFRSGYDKVREFVRRRDARSPAR